MKATVTFFGNCSKEIAGIMLKSARKLNCELVQLTDEKTPKLDGVDTVIRLPYTGDFGAFRLEHFMNMQGDVLHLDYDLILNRDVSDVFERDFDIALTLRNKDKTIHHSFLKASPHNMGVVFSKNAYFWKEVYDVYKEQPETDWMLIQIVTSAVAKRLGHIFKIIELNGAVYNHTPLTENENTDNRAIVHYKGNRKNWMLNLESQEAA